MIIPTRVKVALAAAAYAPIAAARFTAGKNHRAIALRDGLRWDLDLREGIDFSIYLLGAFEQSTRDTLRRLVQPGATAFDIGANIGAHTLGLARSVGNSGIVHAFEPTDFAVEKMRRNLALNPAIEGRVFVHQTLLAAHLDEPMQQSIYSAWPLFGGAGVHPKHRGRLQSTSHAKVDTLDAFVDREGIERVDLIKIDVDGHEYQVLAGAKRLLSRFQPILVMEVSPYVHEEQGGDFRALIELLRDTGYCLTDEKSKSLPLIAEELTKLIPDGASINAIAMNQGTSARMNSQSA